MSHAQCTQDTAVEANNAGVGLPALMQPHPLRVRPPSRYRLCFFG